MPLCVCPPCHDQAQASSPSQFSFSLSISLSPRSLQSTIGLIGLAQWGRRPLGFLAGGKNIIFNGRAKAGGIVLNARSKGEKKAAIYFRMQRIYVRYISKCNGIDAFYLSTLRSCRTLLQNLVTIFNVPLRIEDFWERRREFRSPSRPFEIVSVLESPLSKITQRLRERLPVYLSFLPEQRKGCNSLHQKYKTAVIAEKKEM